MNEYYKINLTKEQCKELQEAISDHLMTEGFDREVKWSRRHTRLREVNKKISKVLKEKENE